MSLKVKLEKEDWLESEPRNCSSCVFAQRVKKLLNTDREITVDGVNHDCVEVVVGDIFNEPINDIKYYLIKDEDAFKALCTFDKLYNDEVMQWVEETSLASTKNYVADSEESRLNLYEEYKDYEWTLEEADLPEAYEV